MFVVNRLATAGASDNNHHSVVCEVVEEGESFSVQSVPPHTLTKVIRPVIPWTVLSGEEGCFSI